MRDKTCETSGLLSVEGADFRQEGEDQRGGDGSEAGDRAQDLALALQGFVAGDMACNRGIEFGELALDEGQAHLALAFQDRIELHMAAVAQAGALLDQCRPCHLQVFEHKQVLRGWRIRFQLQGSPHPGQDACIDGIGLGPHPARFGKATGLQRIDLDQR